MRLSSLFRPATAGFSLCAWSLLSFFPPTAHALSFHPVSPPDLELSSLGRVVFTGHFDGVSLYSYEEQLEASTVDNDNQMISTNLPNGLLTPLSKSDGHINAMCPFTRKDRSFAEVVVGGNFTSLGGVEAHGIAMFNPNTTKVTAMPGISGSVMAVLCDQDTNTVYVGGDLKLDNTTNVAAWVDGEGWKSLPFQGLNRPVTSIIKDDNGHIIFGGSFDGLGNKKHSSSRKGLQVINLQTAEITSDAISSMDGYRDPRNIICQTSGEDAEGKTWLLADTSPGFWRADMNFPYTPTKLRLYNTHLDGRGTKTFLFRALPDNGIMNLTYTDPDSGDDVNCDASCPLSDSKEEKFREFRFVNNVGMRGFMLEIQDWYGDGAGLNGIELFQNKTMAYAIDDFNEPSCANLETPSRSTHTGPWTSTQSGYLTTSIKDPDSSDASVVFEPDVRQSGNYSIKVYTPGCVDDGTCGSRGIVNVTGTFTTDAPEPIQTLIYQTNNYEKYDTIYTGYVDASSDSFRPSVTLAPKRGQGEFTMVAWRVGFDLLSADGSGELNGLLDYDPSLKRDDESDLKKSALNRAGQSMRDGSSITSLITHDGVIYAGGKFSNADIHNIMSIGDGNATAMPEGGLNGEVFSMSVLDDFLYVGGNFTDTADGGNGNLKHVAAYSTSSESWSNMGGGVNGPVRTILALPLDVSTEINETVVAVSGDFDEIRAFDKYPAVPVAGFAVWVPSRKNWLQNIDVTQIQFAGQLTAFATVKNTTLLGGSLISDGMATGDAVSLLYGDGFSLEPFLRRVDRSPGSKGTYTGIYDTKSGRNLTIIGGHFSATTNEGSTLHNVVIHNGDDNTLTGFGEGVDNNSTFLAFSVSKDTLYAGGNVTGSVGQSTLNGYVAFDLSSGDFVKDQPPPLTGENVFVSSIAARPKSSEVYFGGNFESAGALPCPSVCSYDTSDGNWFRPGVSITGTVLELRWASDKDLYAVGDLNVDGNDTVVATYNTKSQKWKSFDGASKSEIPGPVTAFSPASTDISTFWLAGKAANGSTFLVDYDGSDFRYAGDIFGDGTTIRGLEALPLSKNHEDSDYLDKDLALLITGQLVIPDFGNASAALFNGTALIPFILSSTYYGEPGSMSKIITEHKNPYSRESNHHSNGIVVLISFCLSLGCVFLIVVAGVILNKIQRRRQGYMKAPQGYGTDRPSTMRRVPPEYLFNSLRAPNPGAPTI